MKAIDKEGSPNIRTIEGTTILDVTTNKSEVAQFRERQALEEQASRLGLYGSAIVANHASITKGLQQGADRIMQLVEQGKMQEAVQLMDRPDWGADMQETHESQVE